MTLAAAPPLIRPAAPGDTEAIHRLVVELAVYEREPDAVEATPADFTSALFAENPIVFCHVAEDRASGMIIGFALWFVSFSTWRGRHGIWLEDLFVRPDQRGSGVGFALLKTLADVCVTRGYARLEWNVLDWNAPALSFYRSIGAEPLDGWTIQRLSGDALKTLTAS
jgi:GNAT superfamily N-acetyltransferase